MAMEYFCYSIFNRKLRKKNLNKTEGWEKIRNNLFVVVKKQITKSLSILNLKY